MCHLKSKKKCVCSPILEFFKIFLCIFRIIRVRLDPEIFIFSQFALLLFYGDMVLKLRKNLSLTRAIPI